MTDWRDRLRDLGFGNQAVIVGTKRRELFDEIEKIRKEGIEEGRKQMQIEIMADAGVAYVDWNEEAK